MNVAAASHREPERGRFHICLPWTSSHTHTELSPPSWVVRLSSFLYLLLYPPGNPVVRGLLSECLLKVFPFLHSSAPLLAFSLAFFSLAFFSL